MDFLNENQSCSRKEIKIRLFIFYNVRFQLSKRKKNKFKTPAEIKQQYYPQSIFKSSQIIFLK